MPPDRGETMLWAIGIIFALVWGLALVTANSFGGYIHLVLAAAVLLLIIAAFTAGTKSERRRGARRARNVAATDADTVPDASVSDADHGPI